MIDNADNCEAVKTGNEFKCDRCRALWYGELAKTDWRPGECRQPATLEQPESEL